MPDRLLEVLVPEARSSAVRTAVEDCTPNWISEQAAAGVSIFRLLLPAEQVEGLLDALVQLPEELEVKAVVLPVEASLPRPPPPEVEAVPEPAEVPPDKRLARISRQELYEDLREFADLTPAFVVTTALSVVVAAIGLTRESPAIIIGAMVIAPLLGPNMALALATTLADRDLGLRAIRTNLAGVGTTVVVGALAGLVWRLDPGGGEVLSRIDITPGESVLALATGVAGAIAVTTGLSTSLVGVMVAVALLPPLVTGTMLLVQGHAGEALHAFLLVATNVICVNLSGVATFYAKGIRPGTWWEAEESKRATRLAIALWTAMLAVVIALVLVA
jgi:uncharacterized hydrophobic protein (TIGR00341 family)